jgi:hypothetical protein
MRTYASDDSGIALLELGILSIALFSLIIGGLLASERYDNYNRAQRILDRYLHDDAVRPLSISFQGSAYHVVENTTALRQYVHSMVTEASKEARATVKALDLPGDFRVQMGYRVVHIDSRDGSFQSLDTIYCLQEDHQQRATQQSCGELADHLALLGQATHGKSKRLLYSLPTGMLGRTVNGAGGGDEKNQYFPLAVLLGMQVSWKVDAFAPEFAKRVGLSDQVLVQKGVVLRGELAL